MASVAGVPHAIKALYGHDAAQRQAANDWLTSFATSSQAWDCVQLLGPGVDAEVQFFSTNILLSKVRQGWHKLQPELQAQLSSYLRSVTPLQHCAAACNTLCSYALHVLLQRQAGCRYQQCSCKQACHTKALSAGCICCCT